MIANVTAQKESLDIELQALKSRALNQLLAKEKQIIEMLRAHEKRVDELRTENQRLHIELNSIAKSHKNEK